VKAVATAAPGRRQQILDAVVEYILAHGMSGLSLRPVAAHTGTSARLLLYHFGSKQALLAAAMTQLRDRLRAAFTLSFGSHPSAGVLLARLWRLAIEPANRAVVTLLFEVLSLALREPRAFRGYVEQSRLSWSALLEASLPSALSAARRRQLTTLAIATLDGMLLDYLATGDRRRTSAAMALFTVQFDRLCAASAP
jgi:AcrR family transcriptional regulator